MIYSPGTFWKRRPARGNFPVFFYAILAGFSLAVPALAGSVDALATSQSGSCTAAPSGLIGWWPGDGNANDIADALNGTLMGGATATAVGEVGQAFSFDGTNGYVSIPNSTALEPTNLTVEAWVKFSSLNSSNSSNAGHQYIVFKQNALTYNFEGFGLGKDRYPNVTNKAGDVLYFNVSSSSGVTAEVDSSILVATNVWYHIVGVRGTNFLQLFVNGQSQGQVSVNFTQNYGSNPLYFGTSGQSYWDGKLAGQLDEVSLYNRALTTNEILAIYNAGAAGKCKLLPVITNQPASLTVTPGNNATFTVGASGNLFMFYQWQFNGTNIANATTNMLTLTNVQPANAGNYSVIVSNAAGAVTSATAMLTVGSNSAPAITNQPANVAVIVSNSATFSVEATGGTPLNYRWYFNSTNSVGLNTNSLTLANVLAANAGNYSVVITNAFGSVTSAPAVLTVNFPPVITNPPVSLAVIIGNPATFVVGVAGDATLNYQWYFNVTNAVGFNTNTFALASVQAADAGVYSVVITNASGTATSAPASLTVNFPAGYNQILGQLLSSGDMQLSFAGVAGGTYALDRSFNLSPPDWLPILTNATDTNGLLFFTNTPDPSTNNFWRIRSVP